MYSNQFLLLHDCSSLVIVVVVIVVVVVVVVVVVLLEATNSSSSISSGSSNSSSLSRSAFSATALRVLHGMSLHQPCRLCCCSRCLLRGLVFALLPSSVANEHVLIRRWK